MLIIMIVGLERFSGLSTCMFWHFNLVQAKNISLTFSS